MFAAVILSLCLSSSNAFTGFSNVSHLVSTTLAFGASTSTDGLNAFVAGSNGHSVGLYETFNGGSSFKYLNDVGEIAQSPMLMASAVRDVGVNNMSVIAGGLFGAAISFDGGVKWEKLYLSPMVTQDIKYELASGLYGMTGKSEVGTSVALSSNGGHNFTLVPVTGLYEQYIRYGSFPTTETYYVTAGIWGDDESDQGSAKHYLSARLMITGEGKLVRHQASSNDTNTTDGAWAQVAKTSDGGTTWSIIFEDFESGRYPNDIHCYDENTCVFVMEGVGAPQIISTTDGGKTWTTFNDESGGDSLMAARMVGATEAWVSGGGDVGRMWHTTDLVNWEAYTTDMQDAAEIMSFAFNANHSMAFATGILRSQLCDILKLDF